MPPAEKSNDPRASSSTPLPSVHPYNKPASSTTPSTSTPTQGGLYASSSAPAPASKSPDVRPAQFSSAEAGRSLYINSMQLSEAERLRRQAENRRAMGLGDPAPSHSVSGPHHHHHLNHRHHHHHNPNLGTTSSFGSRPLGGLLSGTQSVTPAPREPEKTPSGAATTSTPASTAATARPPSTGPSNIPPERRFPGSYGLFGAWRDWDTGAAARREREEREKREAERKAQLEKLEKERKAVGATSPTNKTSASPFTRPGPTSPIARSTPTPTPGSAKPSVSPTISTSTPAARPNIPMTSGFGGLGARALPSPFDRERSGTAETSQPGHNRTPSGSSRPDSANPVTSPNKPTPAQPNRSMFGGLPHMAARPEPARSPAETKPPTPASAAKPASATTAPGPRNPYSTYSSYAPPYMGFGSTFSGYGAFTSSWAERERLKARDQERKREQDRADELKRQEEKRVADEKARQAQAARPPSPPRSAARAGYPTSTYGQYSNLPWNRNQPGRIEVLNAPAKDAPAQAAATKPDSVINQVAPSREPRPYNYQAKVEPSPQPPAPPPKDREYNYTPRDKRPRMDAAVDDARRGQASKAKRRKEEDKAKSPQYTHQATRDLSSLTREGRKWPEVNSGQVETWLKSQPDLNKVVGKEIYKGSEWTLAQTTASQIINEGAIVMVRVNGGFLGSGWVVRGEKGWDDAIPYPSPKVELGRGTKKRQIWGTDVYTDDSDLGLVLIHAGWVRWAQDAKEGPKSRKTFDDVIDVTVRVVPRLIRYTGTERNGIRTRAWGNGHDGASVVVEGVQRVSHDRENIKSRSKRKLRLAELAQERLTLFTPVTPLEEDNRILNGIDKPLVFTETGVALKYHPLALQDCFDLIMDEPESSEPDYGDVDEFQPPNFFSHELVLINREAEYRLYGRHFTPRDDPIDLALQHVDSFTKDVLKPRIDRILPTDVTFARYGVAIKTKDQEGVFIKVDGYKWVEAQDYTETGSVVSEKGKGEKDKQPNEASTQPIKA